MTTDQAIQIIKHECYVFSPLNLDRTRLVNTALDMAIEALEFNQKLEQICVNTDNGGDCMCQEEGSISKWIPCSERLPEKSGKYLVTVKNGNVYAGAYDAFSGRFQCAATAWQQLPEPYRESEDKE